MKKGGRAFSDVRSKETRFVFSLSFFTFGRLVMLIPVFILRSCPGAFLCLSFSDRPAVKISRSETTSRVAAKHGSEWRRKSGELAWKNSSEWETGFRTDSFSQLERLNNSRSHRKINGCRRNEPRGFRWCNDREETRGRSFPECCSRS